MTEAQDIKVRLWASVCMCVDLSVSLCVFIDVLLCVSVQMIFWHPSTVDMCMCAHK